MTEYIFNDEIVDNDNLPKDIKPYSDGRPIYKVTGELIRCKDCIYYDGYGCCDLLSYFSRGEGVDYLEVNENEDFCSKAERKEEE